MKAWGLPFRLTTFLVLAMAFLWGVAGALGGGVDFKGEIEPLLLDRCVKCHQTGEAKGGLDLSTLEMARKGGITGPAIVPGEPEESYLLDLIMAEADERAAMPKSGEPFTAEQAALLRQWIEEGARWPEGVVLKSTARADKTWWSLQPLRDAELPAAEGMPAEWAESPIDRFVLDRLKEKGLEPSAEADRRTLIRRVTYDLTGLPPSAEAVRAFVEDPDPNAYEKLVDSLLDSPHYGEQWGRHWLDVARFGESNGFERNLLIDNAWPYRDYVVNSFNADKPFDRFIVEQLAGDVVGKDQPDVEVGTTFLVCGPYDNVANQDPAAARVIRANTVDDMITAAGQAFLGLTVHCARCHDHKFDPIPQADYYRMYAAFDGVRHGDRELVEAERRQEREERLAPLVARRDTLQKEQNELEESIVQRTKSDAVKVPESFPRPPIDPHGTEDRFEPTVARHVRLTVLSSDKTPNSPGGTRIDEFEVWTAQERSRNIALASAGATVDAESAMPGDFAGAYSASLVIDGKFGSSWIVRGDPVLTITLAEAERIDRILFSSDRPRAISGRNPYNTFVGEYRIEISLDGQTWTTVAESLSQRPPIDDSFLRWRLLTVGQSASEGSRLKALRGELARVNKEIAEVPELPRVWAGTFEQPREEMYVMLGGDPAKRGESITPASLSVLDQVTQAYELPVDAPESQRRLALARWIVSPGNPLTPRVLANRVWQYHFGTGIVDTPSDFGYLGSKPTHPELLDWLARRVVELGWRLKPLHRDILLSRTYRQSGAWREEADRVDASARLLWRFPPRRLSAEEIRDTMLQTSGALDPRMGGPGFRLYRYLNDNVSTYIPLDEVGPETYRRSVYHQAARASYVDLLTDFDCPDSAFPAPKRTATTTPLQALTLLNHSFTLEMSRLLAERAQHEASETAEESLARRMFNLTLQREPGAEELQAAASLVRAHGAPALARALYNCNELLFVE